MSKKTV